MPMELTQQSNFEGLIESVYHTHRLLQQNALKAINVNLTIRNWLIGCYIVEFEQNGEDRARYGARLLEEMAKSVKARGLKGLDLRALRSCRTFYNVYPQIRQSVISELRKRFPIAIRGTLTPELQSIDSHKDIIRRSVTAELERALSPIIRRSMTSESQTGQTLSVKLQEEYPIPAEVLLNRLSFTHFVELLRKDDPLERLFYEVEAIKNNWSVRELERAMNTALYIRTGLSKDKKYFRFQVSSESTEERSLGRFHQERDGGTRREEHK